MTHGRAQDVVGVEHDLERVLHAHGREGHDRHAVLDGEAREAHALLPHEAILLALVLEDLAATARKHQHDLAGLEEPSADLPGAAHRSQPPQQITPHRDGEVVVVPQTAHGPARGLVHLQPEHGDIEHAVDRVIAGEQHRPFPRYVLEPDRYRREQPLERLQDATELPEKRGVESKFVVGIVLHVRAECIRIFR